MEIRTTEDFTRAFRAARRVSTPLIAVRTPDAASAVQLIRAALNGQGPCHALLSWDIIRGLQGEGQTGHEELTRIMSGRDASQVGPVDVLISAQQLREDGVLFYANPQRLWHDPAVLQGIWNLRDPFKSRGCMLVLLTPPYTTIPPELSQDVLVLDEPLPSEKDLERIVQDTFAAAELQEPEVHVLQQAVDALVGLAGFPAEQALAMSLAKSGLNCAQLWERKRQMIEQTPGLTVWRGGESFAGIGGCENIRRFMSAVVGSDEPPRVVVFVDEIEKAFAGTGTDLSGVKTEMTGAMLSWMQDREAEGAILLGPPGTAKSAVAKSVGNSAGVPTIAFDIGAMQNSLVGSSGERLRAALQIVDAVSQGRSLWIATCNSIGALPPELRRRFTLGIFFFDLPTSEERDSIWGIYTKRYAVGGDLPDDEGWTGAEIKECCRKSARLRISLREAAAYIVPISRSAADEVRALRMQASGKFISASRPGVYQFNDACDSQKARTRVIRQED